MAPSGRSRPKTEKEKAKDKLHSKACREKRKRTPEGREQEKVLAGRKQIRQTALVDASECLATTRAPGGTASCVVAARALRQGWALPQASVILPWDSHAPVSGPHPPPPPHVHLRMLSCVDTAGGWRPLSAARVRVCEDPSHPVLARLHPLWRLTPLLNEAAPGEQANCVLAPSPYVSPAQVQAAQTEGAPLALTFLVVTHEVEQGGVLRLAAGTDGVAVTAAVGALRTLHRELPQAAPRPVGGAAPAVNTYCAPLP